MSRLRPRGDDGNAILEFTYLALLLMVPLALLLTTVFQVQRRVPDHAGTRGG